MLSAIVHGTNKRKAKIFLKVHLRSQALRAVSSRTINAGALDGTGTGTGTETPYALRAINAGALRGTGTEAPYAGRSGIFHAAVSSWHPIAPPGADAAAVVQHVTVVATGQCSPVSLHTLPTEIVHVVFTQLHLEKRQQHGVVDRSWLIQSSFAWRTYIAVMQIRKHQHDDKIAAWRGMCEVRTIISGVLAPVVRAVCLCRVLFRQTRMCNKIRPKRDI